MKNYNEEKTENLLEEPTEPIAQVSFREVGTEEKKKRFHFLRYLAILLLLALIASAAYTFYYIKYIDGNSFKNRSLNASSNQPDSTEVSTEEVVGPIDYYAESFGGYSWAVTQDDQVMKSFTVTASSELTEDNKTYSATNLIDNNENTFWSEGSDSEGVDENFTITNTSSETFTVDKIYYISGLQVLNFDQVATYYPTQIELRKVGPDLDEQIGTIYCDGTGYKIVQFVTPVELASQQGIKFTIKESKPVRENNTTTNNEQVKPNTVISEVYFVLSEDNEKV